MAPSYSIVTAVKPHSAPKDHNQSVPDPIAHFQAIPWCAALLTDRAVLDTIVPDRRPLGSGESNLVRRTLNTPTTVRACVTFLRTVGRSPRGGRSSSPSSSSSSSPAPTSGPEGAAAVSNGTDEAGAPRRPISKSAELLGGGGKDNGEDPRNPFLLFSALVDLGVDTQGYQGTLHGGLFGVLMDEVMATAANFQSGELAISSLTPLLPFYPHLTGLPLRAS